MLVRRAATAAAMLALLAVLLGAIVLLVQGYHYFAVQSDSMEPTIRSGDLVVVAPAHADGVYEPGQIITFHPTPGYTTTHRVNDVNESGIETKGDANATPDVSRIQSDQVVGEVTFVLPYVGYAAVFLQQPLGWISFVLAVVVIVLLWQLMHSKRDDNQPVEPGASAQ
jgi:signal peptidase